MLIRESSTLSTPTNNKTMPTNAKRKNELLGVNYSTASARLQRLLLFDMASRLDLLKCFRCGDGIESVVELSIEHKEAWVSSPTPHTCFFDLSNIAFSHFKCNAKAASKPGRKYSSAKERKAVKAKRRMNNPLRREDLLRKKREWAAAQRGIG